MTVEPDLLSRPQPGVNAPGSVRRLAACAACAVSAAAAASVVTTVCISAALTSGHGSSHAGPQVASSPSTAASTDPAPPSDEPTAAPGADRYPVRLEAPGWTCDAPADEKLTCINAGIAVLVTVRPASSRDAYLSDPDKASPEQFVSEVHDGLFATINRMPDDHDTDLVSLGAALQWADEQ